MKKLLIFVLIIATLLAVGIVPMASATTDETFVDFKGDDIVSDKVEADKEWNGAFEIFSELIDAYYGIGNANPNLRVTFNVGGIVAEGSYADGIFHDVWPDSALTGDYVYNDFYFSELRGYQYADGDVKEFDYESGSVPKPVIIDIINNLKLNDLENTWNRASFGEYDYTERGYSRDGAPTIRFKDGKIVNIAFSVNSDETSRWEINFEYGTAVVPLPPALTLLRSEGKWATSIGNTFSGLDYNVANFMNKISRSFIGGIATFLAKAVSLVTEKGLIFFFIAIALMCFARTRKAGVLMFISVAVGAVFTNFVLKDFVMRTRPYETNTVYYGFWQAVGAPLESGYSFPSGHTTAVMAAATAFFLSFRKKYSWVGFLAVLAVGISRIYLMAHYASDVLVAILVGGIAGILSIYVTKLLYYIVEHYRGNELADAILTKDVSEAFKKKAVAPAQAPTVVATVNSQVEGTLQEEVLTKPSEPRWEETLITLMTEVRDLLKANTADQSRASEILDVVENTVKPEQQTE